jgi:glycerate-2-kinase
VCVLSGGEPVVRLGPEAGQGGRNQQLVLAAVERLWNETAGGWTILSGGTDGEDGPTDAAGAIADKALIEQARAQQLDPGEFLRRNDAYCFFDPLSALIRTGPTQTNVMDVRVAIVR